MVILVSGRPDSWDSGRDTYVFIHTSLTSCTEQLGDVDCRDM